MKRIVITAACIAMAALAGCTEKSEIVPDSGSNDKYGQYLTLGEYKGIKVDELTVKDEDIQKEIDYILKQNGSMVQITDRAVKEGDVVNLDYTGTIDGTPFEGGSAQGQRLEIGSGQFIPGFEEGLIGVAPGEQAQVPVTFPEDYWNAGMAGVSAVFDVKVNYIEEYTDIPEFNDAFVAQYTGGELTTTAQLTDWLREQMEADSRNHMRGQYYEAILSGCEVKGYPEDMMELIRAEVNDYYENFALYNYGMSLKEYNESVGMSEADMEEKLAQETKSSVAQSMILETIAARENITISDEECEQGAVSYGYPNFAEFAGIYGEERARVIFLMDKVLDTLISE